MTSTNASMAPLAVAAPNNTEVILDSDVTGQATFVGTWAASTSEPHYHGTNYYSDQAQKTGKSVSFQPNLAASGLYNVYMDWTGGSNRSNNVPVTVHDVNGNTTYAVNETLFYPNAHFVLLGSHVGATGSTSMSLTISNTGTPTGTYVIADAVRFELASKDALMTDVDDSDAAPLMTWTGTWGTSSNSTAWDGQYHTDGAKGTCVAKYYPYVATDGTYDVYMRWPSVSGLSGSVPVTIYYGSSSAPTSINETVNGGQWFYLGSYPFAAANNATDRIELSNTGTTGVVAADAICLILQQYP